jgi:flagellin-like protein
MKANQAFKANDEAVSPVIGVILMVAITVVLAAVVFVLVSNLSKSSNSAPTVSFTADDTAKTLTVVSAPVPSIGWDSTSVTVGGTCAAHARLNSATVTFVSSPQTNKITGGDVISGCLQGETFTLTHVATNTLLYSHSFP